MGFTKRELIEFLDGLVELASEENKVKAVLAKEKFVSDFENTYGYEREASAALYSSNAGFRAGRNQAESNGSAGRAWRMYP